MLELPVTSLGRNQDPTFPLQLLNDLFHFHLAVVARCAAASNQVALRVVVRDLDQIGKRARA